LSDRPLVEGLAVPPLKDIPVEQRIAVVRGFLDLFRLAYQHTGGDLELASIIAAIRLGVLEGRPLDVSAIAAVTGIPRSTVQRKIKDPRIPEVLSILREGRRVIPTIPVVSAQWALMARNVMQVFVRVGKQLGLK
jgi:hypothetical protein